jgi:hypothetical protein
MPFDLDSFAATVEDRLPCLFEETSPGFSVTVLPGSDTVLTLDHQAMRLEFATPVIGAHNGLSTDDLADLMMFNFPNDLTRGSFLAGGGGAGHLVLTASLPVSATTPDEACAAILDQVAAALALGDRIAQRRAAAFKQGT